MNGPGFLNQDRKARQSDKKSSTIEETTISTTQQTGGAESAKINASSNMTQTIEVSEQSPVSGTRVSFPPGSLAIDTAITIEPSAEVSTSAVAAQLDLGESILSTGTAVSVQPTIAIDPVQPFTISIALPQGTALSLNQNAGFLVVFYKVKIAADDRIVAGVIPSSDLTIIGNNVSLFAYNFGAFQAAYLKTEVTTPKQIAVVTPILTKREVEALPPINVLGRSPFIVSSGEKVQLAGTNFRPSMFLAFRGRTVSGIKVVSDVSASFTVPAADGFGLTNLSVDQDGISQTISIFYRGTTSDLPIISLSESEVCSGVKYYDANGTKRDGTKSCTGPSTCTANAQIGCVTTSSFKAGDFSNLNASNIMQGISIAGVNGSVTLPTAANVRAINGAYGASGSPITPILADCTTDGGVGCVTVSGYPAAKVSSSNLHVGNIKSGVQIGGLTGQYPSSTYTLSGATAMDDLTNFITQLTTDGSFEFWDSEGVRRTGSGDSDITAVADCAADGAIGCKTVAAFPAANAAAAVAGNIKSGVSIGGISGSFVGSFSNCSTSGEQACITSGTYYAGEACAADGSACYLPLYASGTQNKKAIDFSTIDATKMQTTLSVAGVTGTIDITNLTAGNIKNGVTIAGVAGLYPNATYTLPGASGTVDLTNFSTQLTSDGSFEFWDSEGVRRTGSGDIDIVNANVKSGVAFENLSVNGAVVVPALWDVRAGTTVGVATTGLLKVNCRNGADLTKFDQAAYPITVTGIDSASAFATSPNHGYAVGDTIRFYYVGVGNISLSSSTTYYILDTPSPNKFTISAGGAQITGGSPITIDNMFVYKSGNAVTEIWDTIDDYNGDASETPTYTGWSSDNRCGGIDTPVSDDDDNVWKDVTTLANGTTASTCTSTSCSFKDKISGQEWHKADTGLRNWTTALSFCHGLTYTGKQDWRLPSEKELKEAVIHGIKSTANPNPTVWLSSSDLQQYYWSASSESTIGNAANAWIVNLGNGTATSSYKSAQKRVICVRP